MRRFSVDRIIGDIVMCERDDMRMMDFSIEDIPFEIHEGSVIILNDNGEFEPDIEEEERRRAEIIALQNKLKNKK
ncbi:MAG: DUF3006 domain-containing protein [Acutalibacteraceae bacterium]|nr:DUF3006 domain-containing protein [Oscillospiraceae bacterium]